MTNQDHLTQFLAALRSGTYNQANGTLVTENEDGEVAFCCLGVGSLLADCPTAPGGGGFIYHANMQDGWGEEVEVLYDNLPGPELFDWLGLDVEANQVASEYGSLSWSTSEGKDIFLDTTFRTISTQRLINGEWAITEDNANVTLANLNDWGCTFPQIADMIEHFGFAGAEVYA